MNETINNILSRQTIRSYKKEQISDDALDTIIKSAVKAPSARNMQPCHVRFIQNHDYLEGMNKDFKEVVGYDTPAYTRWDVNPVYQTAPTLALIFAEHDEGINAGIMCENIVIAAQSLSLGTCIIGSIGALFEDERANKWKKLFDIPENYKFQIAIAIGIPDEKPEMKPRFDDRIKVIK